MSKVIKQLFLLNNTYQSNSLLYYLQKLPLVGKYVPSSVYSIGWLKVLAGVISVLIAIVMMFFTKSLYAIIVTFISGLIYPALNVKADTSEMFLLIFISLSIVGGWSNTKILVPKKEEYYAIVFMRMSAKSVAISAFLKQLLMLAVGFLPAFILIPNFDAFDGITRIAVYVIMVMSKVVGAAVKLRVLSRQPYANFLKISRWELIGCVVLLLLCVPFVMFGWVPNKTQLMVLAGVFLITGVIAMIYIVKFPMYNSVYKQILSQWDSGAGKANFNIKNTKEYSEKYITAGGDIDGSKTGYAFLAECFNKRHRKLLMNTTRIYIIGSFAIAVLAIALCVLVPEMREMINSMVLGAIPLFTFYMYFMNCGERVVKIYFMNCDNEMLTYRAYRQPNAILKMFTLRLKSIVLMDWLQSIPIAIALPLVLYISGGTDRPYEYVVLFASIMALSTFFSVHNLVIYYALQPFNKEVQMKNPIYVFIKSGTYLICYGGVIIGVNPIGLGIGVVIFAVAYIAVAIPIAYKVAPKTFRLK